LLSVWGDNSQGAPGPNGDERRNGCAATVNAIKSAGGSAKFLLLPEAGHKGNTHMLMMDKNNLAVADLIIGWVGASVAARYCDAGRKVLLPAPRARALMMSRCMGHRPFLFNRLALDT